MTIRRLTLRLYPTAAQEVRMEEVRISHQQLYNAALQERIGAFRQGVSISYLDQSKSLTLIRGADNDMREVSQRAQQMTLSRLERAFSSFFRRCRTGEKPGFPRFKSAQRFPGWSYLRNGYSYKPRVTQSGRWFNGGLYLRDAGGMLKARGKSRWRGGVVKQIDISKRAGRWYASLAVECDVDRQGGKSAVGLSWNASNCLTLAYASGKTTTIDSDFLFQKNKTLSAEGQRQTRKIMPGRRSNRAKKKQIQAARAHGKLANQRKDRAHRISDLLVKNHALIATEQLQIANISHITEGKDEELSEKATQKSRLNRDLIDTAPGMLLQMLVYKAEEAGTKLEFVNTRKTNPSQTCPKCGAQRKKGLSEREHICPCGCQMSRDGASALVMLQSSEAFLGWKPTSGETPKTSFGSVSAV